MFAGILLTAFDIHASTNPHTDLWLLLPTLFGLVIRVMYMVDFIDRLLSFASSEEAGQNCSWFLKCVLVFSRVTLRTESVEITSSVSLLAVGLFKLRVSVTHGMVAHVFDIISVVKLTRVWVFCFLLSSVAGKSPCSIQGTVFDLVICAMPSFCHFCSCLWICIHLFSLFKRLPLLLFCF